METGFDALRRHLDEQRMRRERVTKKPASRHRDPGRPISTTLLSHRIPEHVDAAIASSTDWEGGGQDQRLLFGRLKRDVAHPLLLRGFSADEFLDFMPGYTPPPTREGPRSNVLWQELTTRGRRTRHPNLIVTKAFKFAEETVGNGFISDQDQPEYVAALTDLWTGALAIGRVALLPLEVGVLRYVMGQMRARGYLNVACPCREVGKEVGVKHLRAWRALQGLAEDGVLICRSKGDAGKREAAIYCLSPEIPENHRATKPKESSYGTSPSVKPGNLQVKRHFEKDGQAKHTNSLRALPPSTPATSSGSIGMFHRPLTEGVYAAATKDLQLPEVVIAGGPNAVEDHYTRLWGAWAVLWPDRWPKSSCLPHEQLLVFDSQRAAQKWVRSVLFAPETRKRPLLATIEAHAGLQLWLECQLERHKWRAQYQGGGGPR
jgi:hypothetical protein